MNYFKLVNDLKRILRLPSNTTYDFYRQIPFQDLLKRTEKGKRWLLVVFEKDFMYLTNYNFYSYLNYHFNYSKDERNIDSIVIVEKYETNYAHIKIYRTSEKTLKKLFEELEEIIHEVLKIIKDSFTPPTHLW